MAFATAFFSFRGVSLDALTFMQKAGASVFAIASGMAIYMIWHTVLNTLPQLQRKKDKVLASITLGVCCVLIFWLSSAFNVAGLAGKDAREVHLARYVAELEQSTSEGFESAQLIRGLLPDLRQEAAAYSSRKDLEFSQGIYSGGPGPGAVHSALSGIEGRLLSLVDEAERYSTQSEALNTSVKQRMDQVREIRTSTRPYAIRFRDIGGEVEQIRSDLAKMEVQVFAGSVKRTLENLPREVDVQANYSANVDVAKRQRTALDRVRADISQTTKVLAEFIQQANDASVGHIEALEPISAVKAVVIYADNYPAHWAGGIALDLAPLAIVIFTMIALGEKKPEELAISHGLNLSVSELADAMQSMEYLRRFGVGRDILKDVDQFRRGKSPGSEDDNGEDE
ncbi:MAG: hypothetical protein AAFR51_03945 [Pseudomonadota bacterium]